MQSSGKNIPAAILGWDEPREGGAGGERRRAIGVASWRPERATELRPRHGARQMSGYSGLAAAAAINALQHLYLYSAASSQPSIHSLEVLRVRRGASSSNREWRRVRPMAEIKKFAEAEALGSRGNAGNGDGRGGRTPGRKRGEACKDEKTKNNLKWLEKMIW